MRTLCRHCKRFVRRCLRFAVRRVFFPAVYSLGCLRPIDPKLALFVNDLVDWLPDNFIPLMEQLTAQGWRCVHVARRQGGRLRQYRQMFAFYLLYARARAVFHVEASFSTSCCKPRSGCDIVQLWHACGAFKKFGHSTVDLNWGPNKTVWRWFPTHRYYRYASVSSPAIVPCYAEAYGCPEDIIRPWGVPRTDFYFQPDIAAKCRAQVLEAFPEIGGRKIVLYAPTFRGNNMRQARHDDVLDYGLLHSELGDDCALLLRPHPRARKPLPPPEHSTLPFLFDAATLPIEVLLCAADLVISDYSSLIFEYALLGRPMLFYCYDLEQYDKSRSFYYPYMDFVPGALCWDTEDVIAGVRENLLDGKFDAARVAAFREKFMSACDGNSTARIVERVGL